MSKQSFADLGVSGAVSRALSRRGITAPFPVQRLVLEDVLAGRDVLVKAPTGSGKTLAFGIPLAERLGAWPEPSALVLAPTRELAGQIVTELEYLAVAKGLRVAAVYGGVGIAAQAARAKRAHILVATPGRLEDLLARGTFTLERLRILVLDEADRMLDMGFRPAIDRIVSACPRKRQTLFFSATLDGVAGDLASRYTSRAIVREHGGPSRHSNPSVEHRFVAIHDEHRLEALIGELKGDRDRAIVFVRTKRGADRLVKRLDARGLNAVAIHGNKSQGQRERALSRFQTGCVDTLVATDVAARGLDVDGVSHVINFDPPGDHQTYIHRVGRTGRAGNHGVGITLVGPSERHEMRQLARRLGLSHGLGGEEHHEVKAARRSPITATPYTGDSVMSAAYARAAFATDDGSKGAEGPGGSEATPAGGRAMDAHSWREQLAQYALPDSRRAALCLATSVVPYLGLCATIYLLLRRSPLALLLGIPAAVFLVRSFIVFHDCSHGSFLASRRANAWLGRSIGLLLYSPFLRWRHDHAVHHATSGNLDRRGTGDLHTLTVAEYNALSRRRRLGYRLLRNPLIMFGLGPIVAMIIGPRIVAKGARPRMRRSVLTTDAALAASLGLLIWQIGWRDYLLVLALPAMLAGSIGIWLFYVQHQFEDAYWHDGERWSFTDSALRGSSFLKLPALLRFCTGNIGYHHVHHLNALIPNYNLRRAHDQTPALHNVPTLSLADGIRATKLKLYDEQCGRLVSFRDAAAANPGLASRADA